MIGVRSGGLYVLSPAPSFGSLARTRFPRWGGIYDTSFGGLRRARDSCDGAGSWRLGWVGDARHFIATRRIEIPWEGFGRFTQARLSVELWTKYSGSQLGRAAITRSGQFAIRASATGALDGSLLLDGTEISITGRTPVNDGRWHHLVLTYDGAHATLYVDGQVDHRVELQGRLGWGVGSTLYIGNQASNSTQSFNGEIDEVAVYGRSLSGDEVEAHFAASQ